MLAPGRASRGRTRARLAVGLRTARSASAWRSRGSIAPATPLATWSCSSKTSSRCAVEAVGPYMHVSGSIDQLAGDAHPVPSFPDRAFEDVAHAELARDLLHVDRFALVGEARIAGDHEQPGAARDCGGDFLDHAVGEVILSGVAAQIGERQHRDRRLVRCRRPADAWPKANVAWCGISVTSPTKRTPLRVKVRTSRAVAWYHRRRAPGAPRLIRRGQRRFGDDPPVPDGLQQIVFD